MGLRGILETRHDPPRMGWRPWNLASLFGHVRVGICVNRGDRSTVLVVFRRLPGAQSTTHGGKYDILNTTLFWSPIFPFGEVQSIYVIGRTFTVVKML